MRLILHTDSDLSAAELRDRGSGVDGAREHGVEISGDLVPVVARERRPPPSDRPWLMANMVSSADGAATGLEGRTASLSGPADRRLFLALRSIADVVLAGANTVRAESYGPPRLAPGAETVRRAEGRAPLPRLAVVTNSLRLDPAARLFSEAEPGSRPIVLTSTRAAAAAPDRVAALAAVADVQQVGEASVDWVAALHLLRKDYGARSLLVEGGPTVNAELVEHDLVDELCLTVSPLLLGGASQRIVADVPPITPRALQLDRVFEDQGFLLLRYLRRR